jgi:hypothetical protein
VRGELLNFFAEDLVEGLFSLLLGLEGLVLPADELVVEFVGEELDGVVVMRDEFVVAVDLVGEAAFLRGGRGTAPSLMSSTGVSQ